MKTIIYLLLLLPLVALSQKKGEIYKTIADIPVTGAVGLSKSTDMSKQLNYIEKGYLFEVITADGSNVKLKALNFKNSSNWFSSKEKDAKNQLNRERYNDIIYTISLSDFNKWTTTPKNNPSSDKVTVGLLTLPFKARPSEENLSFDTEFNFNSTVSFSLFRIYGTRLNFQFGAGIGTVGLNESNTDYAVEGSSIQPQDVSTLTVLTGLMLDYNRVQVGIYLGWDHINNQKTFNWVNNGDKWIGFGVGYSIFKVNLHGDQQNTNK